MALIESGKSLKLYNLISIRKKMSQSEINSEILNMGKLLKEKGIKNNGTLVTATFNAEMVNNEPFLDIEILVPIDKKIELSEGYQFKDTLNLNNMVYAKHQGSPNCLQDTYEELLAYITKNNLKQISPTYNVYSMNNPQASSVEEMVVDVYVGVK